MAITNDELLSVIIPIYNGEKVIENCLLSVRNQSYFNTEIIVIDDGSKDSTYSICAKIADEDKRVKVFHKENGGVSSARNYGIEKASGKYMMFVDGDDRIVTDYLEAFMKEKELVNNRIIVIARINTFVNGRSLPSEKRELIKDNKVYHADRLIDIWEAHLWNSPVNKIYLSKVIKDNNVRFDASFAIGEDWLFNNMYARCLNPTGYYVLGNIWYRYDMDANPWRHCSRDDFYKINKYQIEDFRSTLEKLRIPEKEMLKLELKDIEFTISEIRYIVRDKGDLTFGEKIKVSKELYSEETLKARIRHHKRDFSFGDYLEFSQGNLLLVYFWENARKIIGIITNRRDKRGQL